MITNWILILILTTPCSSLECSDAVAVTQVPMQTAAACLKARAAIYKRFESSEARPVVFCVETK